MSHINIETLIQDIYEYLFNFLELEDIINLGKCSRSLKKNVIEYSPHTTAIRIEALITKERIFHLNYYPYYPHIIYSSNEPDVVFRNARKCTHLNCVCKNYLQRRGCTILDPSTCSRCNEYYSYSECFEHQILISEFLKLDKCEKCVKRRNIAYNVKII